MVGDWYLMEYETYIRVYVATKSPNLLPKFIHDSLILQEIAYQTLVNGVGTPLNREKNIILPPLPLYVGAYSFKDVKEPQA
jgi:hypothetical protein